MAQQRYSNRLISRVAFYVSCVSIIFILGVACGRYRIFPYTLLEFGKDSMDQLVNETLVISGFRHTAHAAPSRYNGSGVTRNDSGRAVPGLTLLSGFFDGRNELRLLRLNGSIVNRWTIPISKAFATFDHKKPSWMIPNSDRNVEIQGATALADGSVVFNYNSVGTVKLDRCSQLVWTVPRMTHHALSPTSDGGFWIPSHRFIERDSPYSLLTPPYLEPTVLKVAADGAVLREISVVGLMLNNNLAPQLFANGLNANLLANTLEEFDVPDDIVHLNDVEELSPAIASAFPQFRAGSLLLSLRDYNMIVVVDPMTEKIEWYQTGPWFKQHDPDFLSDGKISVFNNNDDGTDTGSILGGSNLLEIDPSTRTVTVRYGGPHQRMFTSIMGNHQSLGENRLITETRSGRVFEVTRDGTVVWEFVNRIDAATVADITDATRFSEDYFDVNDWTCH